MRDPRAKPNVGVDQVHTRGLSAESHSGGENHLASAAAQVKELLAGRQSGQTTDFQPGKVGRFAEAEVQERPIRQWLALEIDV